MPAPLSAIADDPVASRIRTRRLALGWSLKRLSDATGGLAPSFLFNIENGRKVPSEEVAARIAQALDADHEPTYRAWARAKSRGRTGRIDHDAMLRAWEQLRNPFGAPAPAAFAPLAPLDGVARDTGRLRVPVLARATDPGDGVRPPAEQVINTLSLDPQAWGHDAALARDRFARLRRPFAFALADAQAARVSLPGGSLAVVTREVAGEPDRRAAYVLRLEGRLEVVGGDALLGGPIPAALRAAGLDSTAALRAALIGRIDLMLPDVRQ